MKIIFPYREQNCQNEANWQMRARSLGATSKEPRCSFAQEYGYFEMRAHPRLLTVPSTVAFVGREFVKSARVGDAVLALDRIGQKFLDWTRLSSFFCWRYTIVADKGAPR
jgi:hypothetical protein